MNKYISTIVILLLLVAISQAQSKGTLVITYTGDKNIRQIAEEYLGNPNLWQEILYNNNMKSPDELRNGVKLKIEKDKILTSVKLNADAKEQIDKANRNGAKMFAAGQIQKAINKYEEGIKFTKGGFWDKAISNFNESITTSKKVLQLIEKNRVVDSEARITYRKGDVEKKRRQERVWSDAPVLTKLFVEDRTRTLSNSYAEISFSDKSKIRLNENSQAVIQKSRVDLLNKKSENKVKLVKGDAFALFASSSRKKNELEIPGVEVNINSSFFWVKKEEQESKFANYNGELKVTSNDSSVVLAKNQGSIIPKGGVPSKPIKLLDAPQFSKPMENAEIYSTTVQFNWNSIENAVTYSVVLSKDPGRNKIVKSENKINNTEIELSDLEPGAYYSFVQAVDKFGFPGPFSTPLVITIIRDLTKPYLIVEKPANNIISGEKNITVAGKSEEGITVTLNDNELPLNVENEFNSSYTLNEGSNSLVFLATDKAGNKTKVEREVYLDSGKDIFINYDYNKLDDMGRFVLNTNSVSLTGSTKAKAKVLLSYVDSKIKYRTFASEEGTFSFGLSSIKNNQVCAITVTSPGGHTLNDTITFVVDAKAPEILLTNFRKTVVNKTEFVIEGKVKDTDHITVNGENISLTNNTFTHKYLLQEGKNDLRFNAYDVAGNKTEVLRSITLDTTPPELVEQKISKKAQGEVDLLKVEVKVNDYSDLKKNTAVIVTRGTLRVNKYLQYNPSTKTYVGTVKLPSDGNNRPANFEIKLEDYLGNSKTYYFTE